MTLGQESVNFRTSPIRWRPRVRKLRANFSYQRSSAWMSGYPLRFLCDLLWNKSDARGPWSAWP